MNDCPYCIADEWLYIQNNWLFDIQKESITTISIPQKVAIIISCSCEINTAKRFGRMYDVV